MVGIHCTALHRIEHTALTTFLWAHSFALDFSHAKHTQSVYATLFKNCLWTTSIEIVHFHCLSLLLRPLLHVWCDCSKDISQWFTNQLLFMRASYRCWFLELVGFQQTETTLHTNGIRFWKIITWTLTSMAFGRGRLLLLSHFLPFQTSRIETFFFRKAFPVPTKELPN